MRHQSLFTYSKNKQTSFDIFCFEGARIRLTVLILLTWPLCCLRQR